MPTAPIAKTSVFAALHESFVEGEPCVWTVPRAAQLPFQRTWNLRTLRLAMGETTLTTRWTPSRRFIDPGDSFANLVQAMRRRTHTGAELLDHGLDQGVILSGTDTYLMDQGQPNPTWERLLPDVLPALPETFEPFFRDHPMTTLGFWLSGAGIRSMTHYDDSTDHNLNFQILGSKRVRLWDPSRWRELSTAMAMSLHTFAALDAIPPTTEVTLTPGDVLLIPSCWYHQVDHLEAHNLNLTCWFSAGHNRAVTRPGWSCRNPARVARLAAATLLAGTRLGASPSPVDHAQESPLTYR